MNTTDKWSTDPEILKTRLYFSKMESLDLEFIQQAGMSLYDEKLRPAREMRLELFTNTCSLAIQKGIYLDEPTELEIFKLCQDLAFKECGILKLSLLENKNPKLLSLVMENFK